MKASAPGSIPRPIRPSPRFWAVMCMTGIGAAINTGAITFGDAVAVIGCGGVVGGGAVAGAVLAGAQTIIAVDIDTTNLDWPANSAPPTPSMPATSIRSQPSKN